MMNILYVIIGWIMKMCYSISFNNYILTLFIFALVMQVVLLPFGIKQQRSSVKLAKIRPKEMAIRNKYRGRNDRVTQQKMQMEIQEMYKAEGYSPTAGCLPLLIQLPIIFALFGVVRMPLTYTTSLDNKAVGEHEYVIEDFYLKSWEVADNQINAYKNKLSTLDKEKDKAEYSRIESRIEYLESIKEQVLNDNMADFTELEMIKFMQSGVDYFMDDFYDDEKGGYVISIAEGKESDLGANLTEEAYLADDADYATKLFYKEAKTEVADGVVEYDFNSMLKEKGIYTDEDAKTQRNGAHSLPNFKFIGTTTTLDEPDWKKFDWLLLIPILVFISSFFSAEVSRKLTTQPAADPNQPNPANSGFMRWMMPLMSTLFAFTFPAAIGIYWVFRSIASALQQYILHKVIPAPKFTEEEMKQAINEVKQAKKRKKLVTIEVDEDDTSYDELAISEEKAEKIRRRRERMEEEARAEREQNRSNRPPRQGRARSSDEEKTAIVERPTLKDDDGERKE